VVLSRLTGGVTNEYHPTGELKRTSGSRTYPVEYAYDTAGRLKTNTTWQNFATTGAGAARTVWNYDAWRGFLVSKRYDDGKGPDYTYITSGSTGKGRLNKRFWSRGSKATYSYNAAGELSGITYAGTPTTPNVTYTYDRLGRIATVVQGSITTTLAYNDLGQVLTESYSGGDLAGLGLTNRYNALFLRTNLAVSGKVNHKLPGQRAATDAKKACGSVLFERFDFEKPDSAHAPRSPHRRGVFSGSVYSLRSAARLGS
jgi:YD repeat-containing protein